MRRMKNPAHLGFAVFLILFSAVLSPTLIQAQTPKAKVNIVCNGKVMTDQPQTILSGQAANLSYTVSGGSVVYPRWEMSGNAVADFQPTLQAGKVTPINISDLKQEAVKLHWIDQGSESVTLLYYLSGGGQGSVTAKFNV